MLSWSTDTVKKRERFAYWREVVCQSLFNVSAEAPPGGFDGHMVVRASGPYRFLVSDSSSYKFTRTERNISTASAELCTVLMQARGQTAISQAGNSFVVKANDIAIFDGTQEFNAEQSDGGRRVVAVIPRAILKLRAPRLGERPLRRLDANSRFIDFARQHMLRLQSTELSDIATSLLTENLCNLLALASSDVPPNRLQAELQLEALLVYCRQNLRNSKLTPHAMAEHFGISIRTLHLRFEKLGQTFGSWLLEARLDAAGKALQDPYQWSRSISEIAYNSGFNDLSHFNKSFRARFGLTPGEWRHETVKTH